jgi:hypothetical protein
MTAKFIAIAINRALSVDAAIARLRSRLSSVTLYGYLDTLDLEAQKRAAIAMCNRRIDAAIVLFGEGRIDKEEYQRRIEQNEREIAHWQARTTETEQIALELAVCIEAVNKIATLWELIDDEDKQGLVRSLFHYIVYNPDSQRIVDFRLKPWADRFVALWGRLYEDQANSSDSDIPTLCKADTNKLVRVIPRSLQKHITAKLAILVPPSPFCDTCFMLIRNDPRPS